MKIKIGNRFVGEGEPVYIIAEAGVNHNGSLEMARKMVEVAKESGADAVKYQTFKTENIILRNAPKSTYHIETTGNDQSWFDLLKTQELSREMHIDLIEHCRRVGITFLSTPYDEESADLLDELDVPAYKVASTDSNNIPFLRYLARKRRPMIVSTAMCEMVEVRDSVAAIHDEGLRGLVVMHCTGNYPAQIENANLRAMVTMRKELGVLMGYSDHIPENVNGIAAVALGAVAYEKHFTLDKNLPGPDHRASLTPAELTELVQLLRRTELALGSDQKRRLPSEMENSQKLRKSVVSRTAIKKGQTLTAEMLAIKRPGTGFAPGKLYSLIGKRVARDIPTDSVLSVEDISKE